MNLLYIMWAVVGVLLVAYGALIYEGFCPVLKPEALSAGLLAVTGLVLVVCAKVMNDSDDDGNKNED